MPTIWQQLANILLKICSQFNDNLLKRNPKNVKQLKLFEERNLSLYTPMPKFFVCFLQKLKIQKLERNKRYFKTFFNGKIKNGKSNIEKSKISKIKDMQEMSR